MMGRPKLAASLIAALLVSAPAAYPATANSLSGSIAGFVRDSAGIPQMGASVLLFNRSERLIMRAITNERGIFGFDSLPTDTYSVQVSLASFVPAMKQKIAVQPGMQSLLYVDLASVLSSIELVYAVPGQGALMSDDWKWTLKASTATRPIFRFGADLESIDSETHEKGSSIFSETRGVLNVSAGDPGSLGGTSTQADLGTAFALATSVLGRNQIQLSGNVGYSAHAGIPGAGFRTSYRRDGFSPEIAVTVQQIYLPARASLMSLAGQPNGSPALRTMSLSVHDSVDINPSLRVDYGASIDSVSLLDHLNYMSKFARASYSLGNKGTLQIAYSSGAPPAELLVGGRSNENRFRGDTKALAEDLAALSLLPRISLLDGHLAVQRTQDFELGYEKKLGDTTFSFTGYRESVTNAAMTLVAADELFNANDMLPDISSKSSIFDAGTFRRNGFAASVARALGERVEVGASFGSGGALTLNQRELNAATAEDLRSKLQTTQRFWGSARASAKLPVTGTEISGSYQWMNYSAIMPNHFYLTQSAYPETGLNLQLRQPIPSFPGMPGRLEANAELRNGLAQGYLPISEGGQRVLLVQSPRAVRGGLSFIF